MAELSKNPCPDHSLPLVQSGSKLHSYSAFGQRVSTDLDLHSYVKGQGRIRPLKTFQSIFYLLLDLSDSYFT